MRKIYDVIVVGTGISGLTSAIYLQEKGLNVLVLTKEDKINETNTNLAQGGIVAKNESDSAEALKKDILAAGYNYNSFEAVDMIANEGPQLVFDFLIDKIGVKFSKNDDENLHYTGEAAHSCKRILHYKDKTGEKIQIDLINYASKIGVKILHSHTSIDIITNNHHSDNSEDLYKRRISMGIYTLDNNQSVVKTFLAHYVILATGGVGSLYKYTTNSKSATGDGISMAYRSGADIINAEMIQFHPTSFFHKDIEGFLISESLRGEGGVLLDHNFNPFMQKYSSLKDLAPRDIVSRAIYEEMNKTGKKYMYLDIASTYTGNEPIKQRFSQIYATCHKYGIDITKEPIPIVPVAHYFCGGVKVDLSGRTTIRRLYSVGETSCTGVHGANRLASVSLLEGILWGKKAAEHIIDNYSHIHKTKFESIPDWKIPKQNEKFDQMLISQDWEAIKLTMWNYAGIIRTQRGLERARADLDYYSHRIFEFYKQAELSRDIIELRNAVITASIIVNAAIHNNKSIGCHFIKK